MINSIKPPKFMSVKRGPLPAKTIMKRASSPFTGVPRVMKPNALTDAIRKNSSTKVLYNSVLESCLIQYKLKRLTEITNVGMTAAAKNTAMNISQRLNRTSSANKSATSLSHAPNIRPRNSISRRQKFTNVPAHKSMGGGPKW